VTEAGAGYPPEPWRLHGQLHGAVFLVPASDVGDVAPPGWRLLRVGPRCVAAAVWVSYEPGGVLSYSELMLTVLVRRGPWVRPTVPLIWVDSRASQAGGRELWRLPKQLASFAIEPDRFAARTDSHPLAAATVRPRLRLPGRWPVRFRVVQPDGARARSSPVRATAELAVTSMRLDPDPRGPLALLAGHRPVVGFSLADFRMRFGG
jgi:hypothetical protein